MARISALLALLLTASASAQVTTSQYDNARTGAALHETVLTPANVNAAHFGKIGAFQVDGAVYAQPLVLNGVLFVATEHDSVYAFHADRPNEPPLWHRSFLENGVTTIPERIVQCPFIRPEVGITSTPVIDPASGTLFVLARTLKGRQTFQHLHALDIRTGAEKLGGPRLIETAGFDALRENPRAALLLAGGQVIVTWGSSCDIGPYHGWVMAYDAKTLRQTAVLNVTPNGSEGGIWQSDTGPAADAAGHIYVPTGNGTFGGQNYGDTVLKLTTALAVVDSFTPHDEGHLSDDDLDLGSSGPLLLESAHRLLQPSKAGQIYVLDTEHLGRHRTDRDDIIQEIALSGGGYGAMASWNGHVYFAASGDRLREYRLVSGKLEAGKIAETRFENPGATPSVSADGDKNAIVWAIATRTWNGPDRPAVLYAFDATDISRPIYTSAQNGPALRFVIPVVAGGRLYFGTRGAVEMYGLVNGR